MSFKVKCEYYNCTHNLSITYKDQEYGIIMIQDPEHDIPLIISELNHYLIEQIKNKEGGDENI